MSLLELASYGWLAIAFLSIAVAVVELLRWRGGRL
jgi:hypothetical protein